MGRSRTSPEDIEFAEKLQRGVLLRRMGTSFEDIAKEAGWNSPQAAQKAIAKAIKNAPRETLEEYRALKNAQFDRMLFGVLPRANKGEAIAIRAVLKIEERRSRMMGYDAPMKIAGTDSNGKDVPQGKVIIFIPDNARDENK